MKASFAAMLSLSAKDPAEVTLPPISILSLTTILIKLVSFGLS
jgi:hypothetical protein